MKKRSKNNFFSNSKNLLIALVIIAAALVVYAQVGAKVSHKAEEIEAGDLTVNTITVIPRENAPESPNPGQIYMDNDGKMYYHDGGGWRDLATAAQAGMVVTYRMEANAYKEYDATKCDSTYNPDCEVYNADDQEFYCPEGSDVTVTSYGENPTQVGCSNTAYSDADYCSYSIDNNKVTLTAKVGLKQSWFSVAQNYKTCSLIANSCYPRRVPASGWNSGGWAYVASCYLPPGSPQCWMEFYCGRKDVVGS